MEFITAHCTDIGVKRPTNQDSLCLKCAQTSKGNVTLAVVCDGMGGLQKGELASGSVITAFSNWFDEKFPQHVIEDNYDSIQIEWEELIQDLNSKIINYGSESGIQLGTTITAMIFLADGTYLICHVGDTRAYKITNEIVMLTTDHTLVQREVMRGHISPEEARFDKRRNILLQCIGASKTVCPDFIQGQYGPNETFLLCSDGFAHEIMPQELLNVFSPVCMDSEENMTYIASRMIQENINRGEKDNITLLLIRTK